MNEKAIMNYKKGKRLRKVTILPDFVLRKKGKHDAGESEELAMAYVGKLQDKCQPIENREVLTVEKLLHNSREEAGVLIAKIKDLRNRLENMPEYVAENSPMDIRANRRIDETRKNAVEDIQTHLETLTKIHELINDVNTALELRISEIRNYCSYKIDAYTLGAREEILDFSPKVNYQGNAIERYLEKHRMLDNAIQGIVTSIYSEGEGRYEI